MKFIIYQLIFFSVLFSNQLVVADPVVEENQWRKEFPVNTDMPLLKIDNIWGDIRVRSANQSFIEVSVSERLYASNQSDFDQLKTLIPFIESAEENSVSFQIGERDHWQSHRFRNCRRCRIDYNFDVVVPPRTVIDVSTVNDGKIEIVDVTGAISANNINGPISIEGLQQCDKVKSINDNIKLAFAGSPQSDCYIKTINGNISAILPPDSHFNAELTFRNGQVYSQFELIPQPSAAIIDHRQDNSRHIYRVEQSSVVQIGQGGSTLSFDTLNGDIRINKE